MIQLPSKVEVDLVELRPHTVHHQVGQMLARGAKTRGMGPHLVVDLMWAQLHQIDLYFQWELDYDA